MNIILVEPDYKNSMPPLGLMKLSTFHKNNGDNITFIKGNEQLDLSNVDIVYITSLFTFYNDTTIKCINHYANLSSENTKIICGGLAISMMFDEYTNRVQEDVILLRGTLEDSTVLDINHPKTNIDSLIPDYDILDDIDYKYSDYDSYFIHLSRGCVRSCSFCAVPKIEPEMFYTGNLTKRIYEIQRLYGTKKYIRILDNNILYNENFDSICEEIINLGYGNDSNKIIRETKYELILKKMKRNIKCEKRINKYITELSKYAKSIKPKSNSNLHKYEHFYKLYNIYYQHYRENKDIQLFIQNLKEIKIFHDGFKKGTRIKGIVDFNQGLDLRAINELDSVAYNLGRININPCRIAFDNIEFKEEYIKAIEKCHRYGVSYFSNYMLYNYNDTPEDLYERLNINIELYNRLDVSHGFSFPMRFSPINSNNRKYVGSNWSRMEISGFQAIINVSRGIVTSQRDFFYKAFGKSFKEFSENIHMPTSLLKSRNIKEYDHYRKEWSKLFNQLTESEIKTLEHTWASNLWDECKSSTVQQMKYLYKKIGR